MKSATLRFALGKLRRHCSIKNRTLNGASQLAMIVVIKLGKQKNNL